MSKHWISVPRNFRFYDSMSPPALEGSNDDVIEPSPSPKPSQCFMFRTCGREVVKATPDCALTRENTVEVKPFVKSEKECKLKCQKVKIGKRAHVQLNNCISYCTYIGEGMWILQVLPKAISIIVRSHCPLKLSPPRLPRPRDHVGRSFVGL